MVPVDGGSDGGVDAAAPEVAPAAPPAEAALPAFTCPEGWVAGTGDEVPCLPFAGGIPSCGPSEIAVPGTGCVAIGGACPTGDYAGDLPAGGRILYVDAGAGGGPAGDGTLARPFRTLTAAASAAGAGDTIALAKGSYTESAALRGGVTLWGACAAETRVESDVFNNVDGTVSVIGDDVVVRNVSLGGTSPGITARGGYTFTVRDVIVDGAEFVGLLVTGGATATVEDVVVRNTRTVSEGAQMGRFGRAIEVDRASLTLRRALLTDNFSAGLTVTGAGTTAVAEDVVIRNTAGVSSGTSGGIGVNPQLGSTTDLRRVVIENSAEAGILSSGFGTTLNALDVYVTATAGLSTERRGWGIRVDDGATADFTQVAVEGSHEVGLYLSGGATATAQDLVVTRTMEDGRGFFGRGLQLSDSTLVGARILVQHSLDLGVMLANGSTATLEDVTVLDTAPDHGPAPLGRGLNVELGSRLEVLRGRVERAFDVGVFVKDAGSSIELRDMTIRSIANRPTDGGTGRGINVQDTATAHVERALISDYGELGMLLIHPGTTGTFNDLRIEDGRGTRSEYSGRGITVQSGAVGTMSRVEVDRFLEIALYVSREGAVLDMSDVRVTNGEGQPADGLGGRGGSAQWQGQLNVTRGHFEHLREAGLFASEDGRVVLESVVVADVRARLCAETDCAEAPIGCGAVVVRGGAIDATGFEFIDNSLCGALIAGDGTLDLRQGLVSGNLIGVNVEQPGFDLNRIMDRVRYIDNESDLDARVLPVPETAPDVR